MSAPMTMRLAAVRIWRVINCRCGEPHWLTPGWYIAKDLTRIQGWRLVKHRILWGYMGLVDAR